MTSTRQNNCIVTPASRAIVGDASPSERVTWPRILIVDAMGEIAMRLKASLAQSQWQACQARSAAEAYRLVRPESRGAVIVHVELPNESGWLAAAKLHLSAPQSRVWVRGHADAIPTECLAMIGVEGYVSLNAVPRWFGLFLKDEERKLRPRNLKSERRTA